MKIHGILLVKNEADIIEWSLADASKYLDSIYVLDNGSEDGTWELIQAIAKRNAKVVPMGQYVAPFNDALRSRIFNRFRDRAVVGDWWCRFDADEIYAEDPRPKLARVPPFHHVVYGQYLNYELTHDEASRFEHLAQETPPTINGANCPRYYRRDYLHSEAHFFRHRPRLVWEMGSWPRHMGINASTYVLIKHFRYRSPQQIQLRLNTRQAATAAGWPNFAHETESNWREKLRNSDDLIFDANDGQYFKDFTDIATSREPLTHVIVKHLLHGTGIWP